MRRLVLLALALMQATMARAGGIDRALERASALLDGGDAPASIALLDSLATSGESSAQLWHLRATAQYMRHGAGEDALGDLNLAIDAPPDPDDPRSGLYYELGYVQMEMGRLNGAAESWTNALDELAREGGDIDTEVWWRSDLAEIHRRRGEIARAEEELRVCLSISEAALGDGNGDRHLVHAILLNNLGALLWDQNRLAEAERRYREALRISEDLVEETDEPERAKLRLATARLNLGVLCRDQDRLEESEDFLRSALELAEAAGDADGKTLVYGEVELANTLDRTGQSAEAERLWDEALARLENASGQQLVYRAELQLVRGRSLLARGDLQRAQNAIDESIEIARESVGPEHPLLGWIYASAAEIEAAKSESNPRQLLEICDEALSRLRSASYWPSARAQSLALRARALDALGRRDEAIATADSAWVLVEALRPERGTSDGARHRFLRSFAADANALVRWRVENGELEGALEAAERIRSRLLRDELRLDGVDLRAGIDSERLKSLEAREAQARARLAALQRELREGAAADSLSTELDGALRELSAVENEIRLASPAWSRALRAGDRALDLDALRHQFVPPGQAILYYVLGPSANYVFLIPPPDEPLRVFPLQPGELRLESGEETPRLSLALLNDALRGVVGIRPVDEVENRRELDGELSAQLHQIFRGLIPDDLWSHLRSRDEITIIPDGDLYSLPFEALVVSGAVDDPSFWLDEGPTLRYADGLSALQPRTRAHSKTSLAVLSVSDPDFTRGEGLRYRGRELPRLAGTARESDAIAEAFEGERSRLLRGAAATESAVRAGVGSARYLHIATHGLVDRSGDARLAALALTPKDPTNLSDDGLLQLFEIYDLELNCELAVLSACDTRSGERIEGEGAHALSRGFHVAGADQTIASLWPVEDASTAELMESLFTGIANAERSGESSDVANLLRDAKRRLREDARWSHPAYWAPFLLSGRPPIAAATEEKTP